MNILFTGASSFTGLHFIEALSRAGHSLTAVFNAPRDHYEGIRKIRVDRVAARSGVETQFGVAFGSSEFLGIVEGLDGIDLFCHHWSCVVDYKSPDFDPVAALGMNAANLRRVLEVLKKRGCLKLVLTGSVFEQGEGAGSGAPDLQAVSPYGLSKGLTSDLFRHYCFEQEMSLGKFVIPNPFGPFEEARFTTYLAKKFLMEETAGVNTPDYVRDNIPVSLLSLAYVRFCQGLTDEPCKFEVFNPSCYVSTQGEFALKFSNEMRKRFARPCVVELNHQEQFPEPRMRLNTTPVDRMFPEWDEDQAWDSLAEYYIEQFG